MSFGFSVVNDLGRRVIDETHGLYVVVPATVTKGHMMWFEDEGIGGHWFERCESYFTFARPYKGLEPPLIFMRTNTAHPDVYTAGYGTSWTTDFWIMWYNNIRYQFFGGPGNWTGAFVATIHWNYNGFATPDVAPAPMWASFDRRQMFMVAGTAVDPVAGGMGAVIRDGNGRVVFNSNDNFVEVLEYSNDWQYQFRDEYGDRYMEVWKNPIVLPGYTSGEWISLLPYQLYRRYNGEVAEVYPSNLTAGYPVYMNVIGGRSGSPFHAPVLRVRTKRAIGYTYA